MMTVCLPLVGVTAGNLINVFLIKDVLLDPPLASAICQHASFYDNYITWAIITIGWDIATYINDFDLQMTINYMFIFCFLLGFIQTHNWCRLSLYLSIGSHADGQQSPSSQWIKSNVWTVHSLWKQEVLIQPHHHLHTHKHVGLLCTGVHTHTHKIRPMYST